MDWQVTATGTYTSGGDAFTLAQLGLSQLDFVSVMYDGSASNSNGVALVAPNISGKKWQLFGTGGGSGQTFAELGASTTVTNFQFVARCYGVA